MITQKSEPQLVSELSQETYKKMTEAVRDCTGQAHPMLVMSAVLNLLTVAIADRFGAPAGHAFFARTQEFAKRFPLIIGKEVAADQEAAKDFVQALSAAINKKWANMTPPLTVLEGLDGANSFVVHSWHYFYGEIGHEAWLNLIQEFLASLARHVQGNRSNRCQTK